VAGADLRENPNLVRSRIGVVAHAPMLYPDLTAEENLAFYAELYGVPEPRRRAAELLDAVGLSTRRLDPVRTFSRGMVQRASIARALVHDPELGLLDEPYSGLDPHAAEVFDGLIASQREQRTFVMVSHDLQKGLALCTHALVLARGRVVTFVQCDEIDGDAFERLYLDAVGKGVA
jgi:heme exporter protein A